MTQLSEEQQERLSQIKARLENVRPEEPLPLQVLLDANYLLVLLDSDSQAAEASPIDMMLFCPRCGTQHVDAPEDDTSFRHRMEAWSLNAEWQDRTPQRWTNPPHKSHLCHNCFAVWRPADVPTNGVAQIKTRGKEDNTWTNSAAVPASVEFDAATAMRDKCVEKVREYLTDCRDEERGIIEAIAAELASLTLDQVKPGEM